MEGFNALLFVLVSTVSLSEAFNIDTERPKTFIGTREDFFGYNVHQYESKNGKQIIVGAPLHRNSTGQIYTCTADLSRCRPLHPDTHTYTGSESVRSVGMSTAVSSSDVGRMTSCSSYLSHECDGNSYLNGVCYQFNSSLQFISNFTAAFQECTKREVNLVFLFDGSSSMNEIAFKMNKDFIRNVMTTLSNSSIKFAAVQFSKTFRTVFDFNDYQNKTAERKLMNEAHMNSLTNTHGAINYTLTNLFDNVSSGADPKAAKALVIITDGDPSDRRPRVLQLCEEKNILRYVIGVGDVKLDNLMMLASEPKLNNTFYIQNYEGLNGLLENLQKKIYSIEGADGGLSRERHNELSQSGFSVVHHEDSVVVGSVGSDEWRGVLYEVTESESGVRETEIKDPAVSKDSYLGYSAVLGQRGNLSLLFSGAPRSDHTGHVTLFSKNESTWTVMNNLTGEQIGSYFGASLSLLDVNSDGDSDFLLVGAPLFHQPQSRAEGRLYVYVLGEKLSLQKTLNVSESKSGRFSASLASLKDLNGDSVSDVAVGAPLEDEGEGAIYIYLGDMKYGIKPTNAPQRISARGVLRGLQQFGVSLSGEMDMDGDHLTDVVVGAQGVIVLLKARPVMSVSAQLSFSPKEININSFECPGADPIFAFNLTSCFTVKERTRSTASVNKNLNVTMNLNVDNVREMNRGFFDLRNSSSRALQQSVLLDSNLSCSTFSIYMPKCVTDTFSPLKIQMNFLQSGKSTAVLDIESRTELHVEVPFQRNCGSNNTCVSDLQMNFSFMNDSLLVVNQAHFPVLISLENRGDDSYNTSIVLQYAEGLSLAKFEAVESGRIRSSCGDRDIGATNRTTCSISLPVYRSRSKTKFLATFRLKLNYDWTDTMEMIIGASSDNNRNGSSDTAVSRRIPVQIAVDLAISLVSEGSVMYVNFSLEDRGPKNITITYKVENVRSRGLPVSVTLLIPCRNSTRVNVTYDGFSMREKLTQCRHNTTHQDGHCEKFECHQFNLKNYSSVHFILTAHARLQDVKEYETKYSFYEFREDFALELNAYLEYNRSRYNQTSTDLKENPHKSQAQVKMELIVPPSRLLIICLGAGGGFLFLFILLVVLYKCGFFKRKRPEEFNASEQDENLLEEKEGGAPEDSPLISSAKENGGADGRERGNSERESGEKENGGPENGAIIPDPDAVKTEQE